MRLRVEDSLSPSALTLLRRCYQFVNTEWQHAQREALPDQGFEMRFRDSCIVNLKGWVVSQNRELRLGCGLDTASGVLHEVDIVVQFDGLMGILELKNRHGWPPEKNDVIVFFAKIIDYLALNTSLLRRDLLPVFMSCFAFEQSGLGACLGLGIHPVAPQLRPFPLLVENVRRMAVELDGGVSVSTEDEGCFEDFCATLNRLSVTLAPMDINRRCDYLSDASMVVSAVGGLRTCALADEFRTLNAECSRLIGVFRAAKSDGNVN